MTETTPINVSFTPLLGAILHGTLDSLLACKIVI